MTLVIDGRSSEVPGPPLGATAPAQGRRAQLARGLGTGAGHLVMASLTLFTLGPVTWMYLQSFRPESELLTSPLSFGDLTLTNYAAALAAFPWPVVLANTFVMASVITLAQLFTGLLAAYAFSCWTFAGQRILLIAFVLSWTIPFHVTMLPNYVLLVRLGLVNSIAGVAIPQLSAAFAVILLRQHLMALPQELLDAARVDGRRSWSTLWRVVVPNLTPSIAALAILLFVSSWNEYLWPVVVFHTGPSVLQLAIQGFLNVEATDYGGLLAASGLACLPLLALYALLQRRVVDAFVHSGLR